MSGCSGNVSNNLHIEIIEVKVPLMVAEFASPRPSAVLAEGLDLAKPDERQNGLPAESVEQCQVVEDLEALLKAPGLGEEEHQDFWVAIQAVMDETEGEDDESAEDDLTVEQPGALVVSPLADRPSIALALELEDTSCEIESDSRVSEQKSFFELGALLPFNVASVESDIDSSPTWAEVMVVFGQEIQRIREAKGLSLDQIRLNTQVPVYQLEAVESGAVERLPEEIFVRGFLNRICTQLGPEGKALLAQLPTSQTKPQELLADWQKFDGVEHSSSQVVHLRSAHLYVGYATLLAGAAGGLAWSFQEAAQVSQPEILPQPSVQNIYSQAKLHPTQRLSRLTFGMDVAPPEAMMPESGN